MSTSGALSVSNRASELDDLDGTTVDVVIIGGGITGAGVARELSRRGASVALFEAGDFASGTSSRSSKLIHGGFRYLAQGDVATVRKVAKERSVIHGMAPHLCEPNWMVFPTSKKRTLATMVAGVTTYEKIGGVDDADRHQTWSRDELAEHEPLVDRARYGNAIAWREYITDDARLVLANLRDAVAHGAFALNHCPVTEIVGSPRADGVVVRCGLTDRTVSVRSRAVINAAGPWVDPVRSLESPTEPKLVLSKGIHLVVPRERLPVNGMVTVTTLDKRSVFIVPRVSTSYIGTTDTLYDGPPTTWPEITVDDATYLLDAINDAVDIDPLTVADVTGAWAGLRPLIDDGGKTPGEISRKDELWLGPRNVVTVAGGKLTGFRAMAIDVVDRLLEIVPLDIGDPTDGGILPGGDFDGEVWDEAERLASSADLHPLVARRLVSLYGTEAAAVLALGTELLVHGSLVVRGEIQWAALVEGAASLEDVFYRRTRSAWFDPANEALIEPMADALCEVMGWDAERRRSEITAATERLAGELAFRRR